MITVCRVSHLAIHSDQLVAHGTQGLFTFDTHSIHAVRILRVCPWYEELEPVLRDRPMARPMRSQDTLAHSRLDMADFTPNQPPPSQQESTMDPNDSDPYEGWQATPPRHADADHEDQDLEAAHILDPALKEVQVSASETSLEESARPAPRRRSSTPSGSQSSRKRQKNLSRSDKKSSDHPFDDPSQANARDTLGLKALMSQMPTREERADSQNQVVMAQERMTNMMTEAMTSIITTNRAIEISAKKELALQELQYKNRLARGNMVVQLIQAGRTPEEARLIAREEFPDN